GAGDWAYDMENAATLHIADSIQAIHKIVIEESWGALKSEIKAIYKELNEEKEGPNPHLPGLPSPEPDDKFWDEGIDFVKEAFEAWIKVIDASNDEPEEVTEAKIKLFNECVDRVYDYMKRR